MNKILNLIIFATIALALGGCSKETPFDDLTTVATGKFSTKALSVELQNENGVPDVYNRPTRSGAPEIGNFRVDFIKEGETEPTESYLYSEMPEIVVLPVGNYTASAHYGENLPAAWENPYYEGSTKITIKADEITEDAEPIVCSLSNIRVSVVFDPVLARNMSDDSKVTVYMGDGINGKLDFTKNDSEKSGYFSFLPESTTLAAVFSGVVEGYPASETKAYDNVAPGRHYRITFRLRQAGAEDPGDINLDLSVDASVEIVDMNSNLDFEDNVIEDDMRPTEGDNGDEPGPGIDPQPGSAPAITAKAPITLDGVNYIDGSPECELYIHSETGIETFKVEIDSPNLTEDELQSVGLAKNLDLVNPDPSYEEGLIGLGFPVRVGGEKDVTFSITTFLPMLGLFGNNRHTFRLTVSDANGTTVKELVLQY